MDLFLLLLTAALLADLTDAQYSYGCSRQVTYPTSTATFTLPSMPPHPASYPVYQPPHLTSILPQYCPPPMPPTYCPPPMPPPYCPPPPVMMPLPPQPKDCQSAKPIPGQHPMPAVPGYYPGPGHPHPPPPVVVQSVYVGKREDEEDKDKEKEGKCCKKKKKRCEASDEEHEEGSCSRLRRKRRRRLRRQRRRFYDIIQDSLDPENGWNMDDMDMEDPQSRSEGCNAGPRIVYIDNQ